MEFKAGDKVRHKANPEFDMVIIDFAIYWPANMKKVVSGDKNSDYPVCRYYNKYTNKWDTIRFQAVELEIAENSKKTE